MPRRVAAALLILLAAPLVCRAQVPAGPEFRVNTYTTANQYNPSLAVDRDGNFVVVWNGDSQYAYGVFAQRYDAAGAPRGVEFSVGSSTTFTRRLPTVAADARGNFVVAWIGFDGSGYGVFGQRCAATGALLGAEFQVNTTIAFQQYFQAIASDADGDFVVVWVSANQDGSSFGVFGQRYDKGGARRGSEFRVNRSTTGAQFDPAVASAPGGNFVVAWTSDSQYGGTGVFAQRYDAAGAPQGSEFRVNTYTTSAQNGPAVAVDASGDFVVAWSSYGQDGSYGGVFAQRYDASGAPRGAELRVNTFTSDTQRLPAVAADASGAFVVAWRSFNQEGDSDGVFAQRFDETGTARGAEFQVNTYTTYSQGFPSASLGVDAVGNFVVSWASLGQDGSYFGTFGQRFGGLHPLALDVDSSGNHVLEPGEAVDVRPTWRNLNGLAQTFGGVLGGLSGPAGATYAITDPIASYGTVANNASAQCTDCYEVSVSAPPVRPVLHWDASALETITPDAQGQKQRWLLHLGDSFTDVPRTSGFYRFVEILLHRGITGGCGGASYCPSTPTTREQMAVFVLLAKEGAGYTPAACAPPNVFGDVPETSPFCRYIEELAGRGVVSGCGGGSYCPLDPVTREQMAVFVLRTLDPSLSPPACTTPVFADVPSTSPFCRWVEELFRRGVVSGCGGGNYCPAEAVTREQMGVFLSVTFGLTLYGV